MPVPVRLREGEGGLCGQPPKEPKTLVNAVLQRESQIRDKASSYFVLGRQLAALALGPAKLPTHGMVAS